MPNNDEFGFYKEFNQIPEFAEADPNDKLIFGEMYADEAIKNDPEGFADPAEQQALRDSIRASIKDNTGGILGSGITLGEAMGEAGEFIKGTGQELMGIFDQAKDRSFKENMRHLAWFSEDAALHAAGIPGRAIAGLAQLPYQLPSFILERAGAGDSAANQWLEKQIEELEINKQKLNILNSSISEYEPGIFLAAAAGGGTAALMRSLTAKAGGAVLSLGGPGMSAADAALVGGYTAAAGESFVVNPVQTVAEHYIGESGYSEERKNLLRVAVPIVTGIVSGATIEARLDKIFRNPLVVEEMVAKGASPKQIADEIDRTVKAPTLFEKVQAKTDGVVTADNFSSHGDTVADKQAIQRYFDSWTGKTIPAADNPDAVMARYYDSWVKSAEKTSAMNRYYGSWLDNTKAAIDRLPAAEAGVGKPAVDTSVAAQKIVSKKTMSLDEFAGIHRDSLEVLSKYYPMEEIERYTKLTPGSTEIRSGQAENMLIMTYRIPQDNTWTPEMLDDMIKSATSAETIYAKTRAIAPKKPSVDKVDLLDHVDAYVNQGRIDPHDRPFIKKMIKVLKEDENLFNLIPVRDGIAIGKETATGSFEFTRNLIKLKDPDSFPHEIGHWGFMNGLDGADRIDYLKLIKEKLERGWVPGENLAIQKFMVDPTTRSAVRSNRELNVDEYFAEQYAQWMYTRNVDNDTMRQMFRKVRNYMARFFGAMKNENLLDQDLQPFFERFAVIEKKRNLLHNDLNAFGETTALLHKIMLDTRQIASRRKASLRPEVSGDPLSVGSSFRVTKKMVQSKIYEAYQEGLLTKRDAQLFGTLNDRAMADILYDPKLSKVARYAHDLGLTGVENPALHQMARVSVANQSGFVDAHFLRSMALHSVPLIYGMEVKDGQLQFSVNRYLKGAAVWYGLGIGGKIYRRIGAPQAVKRVGSAIADKFWKTLPPNEGAEPSLLNSLRKAGSDLLTAFRPTEGIDPDIWALGKEFTIERQNLLRQFDEFSKSLRENFTPEEREMISDFIEKEDGWNNVPQVLRDQADETRKLLTQVRTHLVDSGVDPSVVNRYGDQWLHRVYIPRLAERKTYKLARARFKSIQGHYLMRRGRTEKFADVEKKFGIPSAEFKKGDTVYSFLDKGNRKRWAHSSQRERVSTLRERYGDPSVWKVTDPVKGKVQVARDFTKTERMAMGESRDVALRLAVFFRESAHDIALGHMFKSIDSMEGAVLKIPEKTSRQEANALAKERGYVFLPKAVSNHGIMRYGALSGKYVRGDVARVMERLTSRRYKDETTEFLASGYKKILGAWKIGKTAYQPQTHLLNTITNLHLAVMDGREPVRMVYNGIGSLIKKDQYYREAIEAGLLDSSIVRGEWSLDDYVKGMSSINMEEPEALTRTAAVIQKTWKGIKTVAKSPIKLYSWEDEVFKLGTFIDERNLGKSPKEALAAANKLFFDYSDVPKGVQFLRETGIVPFISYTYKIIPTIAKTFSEHPERIAGLLLTYKAISDWTYENEFGEKAMQQKQLEEAVLPEWQQKKLFGVGPSTQVRLPTDPRTGEARFLEAGRYIPGADLFQDLGQAFPFGLHPIISLAYGWKSNKHPSFGRKLLPHDDPQTDIEHRENMDATIDLIAKTLLPNIPGIPYTYSSDRIGNALVASGAIDENSGVLWDLANKRGWSGKNYFGHEVSPAEEVSSALGLRVSRTDVPQAVGQKIQRISNRPRIAKRQLYAEQHNLRTTPGRMEAAAERYQQSVMKSRQDLEELSRLLEAAR
jgi:hypothetical protein